MTPTGQPRLDVSFLDSSSDARRRRHRDRARRGLLISGAITLSWILAVTATGAWGRVFDNWAAAVTMVFGSFVAGSTPQGGGAVAFPVFTKILDVPAEVARSFSLCIQTVGMGAASLSILVNRRRVEWQAVVIGAPVAIAAFLATLLLAGNRDALFWPSRIPGAYVKVTFTLVLISMAWVVFLGWRTPVRRIDRALPELNGRLRVALVVAGILGGTASALVGSGADVFIYLFVVVLFGVDPRIGIPTSVIVMAIVSTVGFVVLGLVDGQLDITLDAAGAVTAVGGTSVGAPLEAGRYDLYGLWLAATPIVAWGAPLGAWVASRLRPRHLVMFVMALSVAETISTIVFLDDLHDDAGLIVYGALGLAVSLVSLSWLAANRRRVFDLPAIDPGATLSRVDVEVTPDYPTDLGDR